MNACLSGTGHGAAACRTSFRLREVVAIARGFRQREDPLEVRGDHVRARHAVALDDLQRLLGVPARHHDDRRSDREVHLRPVRRARVVQRPDGEVHVVRTEAPPLPTRADARRARRRKSSFPIATPFGRPVVPDVYAIDRRPAVADHSGSSTSPSAPRPARLRTRRRRRAGARRGPARALATSHDATTTTVAPESRDDPPGFVGLEVHVDRDDDRPEPAGTVRRLEELDAVRDHDRDAVAAADAERVQCMRDAPGAVVELGVGAGVVAEAQRDLVGSDAGLGDYSCVHP